MSGRMTGRASQRSDRCSNRVPSSCKSEVMSGLRRDVTEIFVLLGFYIIVDCCLVTDVSGQIIGPVFKGQAEQEDASWIALTLKTGPVGCPETSETNEHYALRHSPGDRISQVRSVTC